MVLIPSFCRFVLNLTTIRPPQSMLDTLKLVGGCSEQSGLMERSNFSREICEWIVGVESVN